MEVDMSVKGPGGLELKNPVVMASGSITLLTSQMKKGIDADVSLVDVKTATGVKALHTTRRVAGAGFLDKIGLPGTYSLYACGPMAYDLDTVVRLIKEIKPYAKEHGVLVQASYGFDALTEIDEYIKGAQAIEAAGADIFKLFPGCPFIVKPWPPPPEDMRKLAGAVKKEISIPMISKWSASWSIEELLAGLEGLAPVVDGLEIQGCCPVYVIDVENARPFAPMDSLWGHCTRPLGVRTTYEAHRYLQKKGLDAPICSSGGVSTWRDAVERMMVGATYVNLHTAVQYRGFGVYKEIIDGTKNFLARKGYDKASDIIGITIPWLDNPEWAAEYHKKYTLPKEKAWIYVDPAKCTGCKRCEVCSWDAIHVVDNLARVDLDLCERCGLCASLCPQDAITLAIVE